MEQFMEFLTSYGLAGILIVLLIIGATELIKIPIMKAINNKVEETGNSKRTYTVWLTMIPFVLAFAGSLIHNAALYHANPFTPEFSGYWGYVMAEFVACFGLSVVIYNFVHDLVKAHDENNVNDVVTAAAEVIASQNTKATAAAQQATVEKALEEKKPAAVDVTSEISAQKAKVSPAPAVKAKPVTAKRTTTKAFEQALLNKINK